MKPAPKYGTSCQPCCALHEWAAQEAARSKGPPAPPRYSTCSDCRFFQRNECHRHPPTVEIVKPTRLDLMRAHSGYVPDRHNPVWPTVHPHNGCGEWQSS